MRQRRGATRETRAAGLVDRDLLLLARTMRRLFDCTFLVLVAGCTSRTSGLPGDAPDGGADTGVDDAGPPEPDDLDAGGDEPDTTAANPPPSPNCKKRIKVVLRTNYGMEAFDPGKKKDNAYPNTCWLGFDESTGQTENMASGLGQGWRGCGLEGCKHDPAGATHWYYDDTSPQHSDDRAAIVHAHDFGGNNPGGMKGIKGTVDMARRPDPATGIPRWKYFQVDVPGYPDIINRWFAETHNPVGDHAGYEDQNNDYIDEWAAFIHEVNDYRIRPQLVIISSTGSNQKCQAAHDQVLNACKRIGSGRSIGLTMEGGLRWDYGHCEGLVVQALNTCMCKVAGGCF